MGGFRRTGLEFADDGDPVEDLAWAEWIVKMHHPGAALATPALFESYGWTPSWPVRHAAMLEKCVKLVELCRRRGHQDAVDIWQLRAQITRAWSA